MKTMAVDPTKINMDTKVQKLISHKNQTRMDM